MKEEIEIEIENGDERKLLKHLIREVRKIHQFLERHFPNNAAESALLRFENSQGEQIMPASIAVGGQATAVFTEFSGPNGSGSVVAPVGSISFASDNPSVATVDPVSGIATGVSAGTANISGADSGNQLTASDVLTVTGGGSGAAQSATLVLTADASSARRSRF